MIMSIMHIMYTIVHVVDIYIYISSDDKWMMHAASGMVLNLKILKVKLRSYLSFRLLTLSTIYTHVNNIVIKRTL